MILFNAPPAIHVSVEPSCGSYITHVFVNSKLPDSADPKPERAVFSVKFDSVQQAKYWADETFKDFTRFTRYH